MVKTSIGLSGEQRMDGIWSCSLFTSKISLRSSSARDLTAKERKRYAKK